MGLSVRQLQTRTQERSLQGGSGGISRLGRQGRSDLRPSVRQRKPEQDVQLLARLAIPRGGYAIKRRDVHPAEWLGAAVSYESSRLGDSWLKRADRPVLENPFGVGHVKPPALRRTGELPPAHRDVSLQGRSGRSKSIFEDFSSCHFGLGSTGKESEWRSIHPTCSLTIRPVREDLRSTSILGAPHPMGAVGSGDSEGPRSSPNSDAARRVAGAYRPFAMAKEGQDHRFVFLVPGEGQNDCSKRYERILAGTFEATQVDETLESGIDPISLIVDGIIAISVGRYAFFHGNSPSQLAELARQRRQSSWSYADAVATAAQLDKLLCSMDATPDPVLLIMRGKLSQHIIGQSAFMMALDYALQDRRTALREQLREQHRLMNAQQPRLQIFRSHPSHLKIAGKTRKA